MFASMADSDTINITIYADGGCLGNPGPGGYGAVLLQGDRRKELSGGFRLTTNNRMELMGAIMALEALKARCKVTLHSDSQYVVNAVEKGWAQKWRRNGWRKPDKQMAMNPDLWERLLDLCSGHDVKFVWVRGHNGNVENERCDALANAAQAKKDLPPDTGYAA
jgi:ribonuclease HI